METWEGDTDCPIWIGSHSVVARILAMHCSTRSSTDQEFLADQTTLARENTVKAVVELGKDKVDMGALYFSYTCT